MTHDPEPIKRVQGNHTLRALIFLALTFLPCLASGQSLPKIRMAYMSIAIQFTPVYYKILGLPSVKEPGHLKGKKIASPE